MAAILRVRNVSVETKEDKRKLLDNISFEVGKKSIYALMGPNGSGKSTLAYALMGLPRFKIISGRILFRNKDITKLSPNKRAEMGMSLSFQEPAYFDGIKVRDFLTAGNKELGLSEAKDVLALVGLEEEFLYRNIDKTLSGGERKRIELASLIAMRPKLMILDEPDSGLDIIIFKELYNILINIKKETGASIVLITHREETAFVADKIGFLYKGRILYEGSFKAVMKEYCRKLGRGKLCREIMKKQYANT